MTRDRMFGLGEPLAWEALSGKNDAEEMLRRVEKLGFSDWSIPGLEEKQIDMTARMFDYIRTMPYVKTIHYFRLNAPSPEEVDSDHFNPVGEECFGLFRKIDGKYQPRPKAYGLQKVYGGKGNLAE